MRTAHTFRLPPELARKLADYAARKHVPQALVVETALASFLSPDGADRLEAALARRLDRMTRRIELLERHVTISNEAMAVFVRFWLTSTPPLPALRLRRRKPRAESAMRGSSKRSADRSRADESSLTRSAETSMPPRPKPTRNLHSGVIGWGLSASLGTA
jgi:hypothetical protein